MKTLSLIGVCLLLVCTATPSARAQYSLSMTGNAASVAPGQTFSFTLTLTSSGATSVGLSYFLQVLDGGGNGLFRITARDLTGSTFSDPITSNAIALQSGDALLDPRNNSDLGAILADPNAPNGAGSFLVANYTLQALGGIAPGVYTISTANAIVTDASFGDNAVANATFNVTVVPEPSAIALLIGGAALGAFSIRRRLHQHRS